MLFKDMSWMDVERYLQRDDRVVVVTGSCEQHGFLSLASDVNAPLEIAKVACEREGVPIAPPLNYGMNPFFNAYPGNLSLSPETYVKVIRELIGELIGHGLKRILVSNGHGGNTGVLTLVLDEISNANPQAKIALFQWWLQPDVDAVAQAAGYKQAHANWSESFKFSRVGPVPDGQKPFVTLPKVAAAQKIRELLGDGSVGGYYQAPDDLQERFFNVAVEAMIAALREL